MPYLSEVIIALTKEARVLSVLLERFPEILIKFNPTTVTEQFQYWEFEPIPWGGDHNKQIMKYFNYLNSIIYNRPPEFGSDINYCFIRMGENTQDIEIIGDPAYFSITLDRKINIAT